MHELALGLLPDHPPYLAALECVVAFMVILHTLTTLLPSTYRHQELPPSLPTNGKGLKRGICDLPHVCMQLYLRGATGTNNCKGVLVERPAAFRDIGV